MNKIKQILEKVTKGAYGVDILSRDILWFSVGVSVINIFLRNKLLSWIPLIALLIVSFRTLSKNFSKRYNENRIYTNITGRIQRLFKQSIQRVKDFRKFKYFKCPNCNQKLRVPRGKKEIIVTCNRCKTKFDART